MIETQRMSIVEFDAWVRTADEGFVFELHDGVIHSFATGTAGHARLCMRLGGWISALSQPPCETFIGLLAVRRHPERPSSVVPDILVTCEQTPPGQVFVTAPKVVVEVISPTSVINDLYRKPRIYEAVPSIEGYLVVDSRAMWACVYRRDDAGRLSAEAEGVASPDATVEVRSIGLTFTLADLYRGILGPGFSA